MTTNARASFGATVKMADTGSPTVAIAELTSVGLPGRSRAAVDVTSHDSAEAAMEYIYDGVKSLTSFTLQGHYIAGSTGDDAFANALDDGEIQDMEILVKAATGAEELAFKCLITEYTPDALEVAGKQTFSVTVQPTGWLAQGPAA
jgi:predicted secreted protein